MGGLTHRGTNLNDLHSKARALTSDVISLSSVFVEESSRLNRMHMASQLIALRSSIMQQLHTAKATEDRISCGYAQADMTASLVRSALGVTIKLMSQENNSWAAIGDRLLQKPIGEQHPFGTFLVSVGLKGVPDDVEVVSVSQSARDSKRAESLVIDELIEKRCLLFSENQFSLLVDKLIEDIQAGRLTLPIPQEKLPQIKYTVNYNPESKQVEPCLPVFIYDKGRE